jgi:quinol monooxygenase YgiN
MYGTVARMKIKPGKMDDFLKSMEGGSQDRATRGYMGEIVYKMDSNPNEVMLCVFFKDKESYHANANSPEMNKEYEQYRALLDADPQWNDGEVIHQNWVGK